jgi:hypothetical protein
MSKKEILCEGCEAVFRIQHNMEERYYQALFCPFCGEELNSDNEDDLYDPEDDDW